MRIKPTSNFGYHIKFTNGATVSVQYGYGNYCENRHDFLCDKDDDTSKFTGSSETAEIAAWDETGEMFQLSGGAALFSAGRLLSRLRLSIPEGSPR